MINFKVPGLYAFNIRYMFDFPLCFLSVYFVLLCGKIRITLEDHKFIL